MKDYYMWCKIFFLKAIFSKMMPDFSQSDTFIKILTNLSMI